MAPPKDPGAWDVPPPQNLPPAGGKEIRVHRENLHNVAKALHDDLQELNKAGAQGSPDELHQTHGGNPKAMLNQEDLGNYPAAQGVYATVKTAYSTIGSTYSEFLTGYDNIVKTLTANAKNYDNTEDANTHNSRRTGSDTGNPPDAG